MAGPRRWLSPTPCQVVAAGLLALALGARMLQAQGTTGKIEGTVRDQTGTPVGGAQVFILGTTITGVSNASGYYFLNNVPAGVHTLRSQYIGYAPAEVREVRVWADQTMTVNIPMEARPIEVSGVTVTVERTPIVPRDQVTSKQIVQGDAIQALPVDNVSQVLRLQPGVVEGRTGQTIRGGRPGDAATYIDGVLVRSQIGVTSPVTVGTNAIEEASVTTGAVAAEYGDAQSGVINLLTRAGGPRLRGNLAFSTDEPAGQVYGQGLNRLEASLGGPLPVRGLSFFVATTLQGQQNERRPKGAERIPEYVLAGTDTTVTVPLEPGASPSDSATIDLPRFVRYSSGSRLPFRWSSSYAVDGKLQYSYGTGSRLSFTTHSYGSAGPSAPWDGSGDWYNTMANAADWSASRAYILNWTQAVRLSGERALFVGATLGYQREQAVRWGSVDPQWAASHARPWMWFSPGKPRFLYDVDTWQIDERLLQNLRLGNCGGSRDASRPDLPACIFGYHQYDLALVAPYRFSPYGAYAFTSGFGDIGSPRMSGEIRYTGRVHVDWQVNRYNRLHVGGDAVKSDLAAFDVYHWSSTSGMDAYLEHPRRFGLFASDRIDIGDLVIDLGVRWDRMDTRILYPRVPGVNFTDPIRTGSLVAAYSAADTAMALRCGALYTAVQGAGATVADTAAWSTCNYFRAPARDVLAPRIAVSFPVTDRTGFRLSYAHMLQTPSFLLMARRHNLDGTLAGGVNSRPLDFGKTIIFEFGVRHAFSPDLVLDVAAYNRDTRANVAARTVPVFNPVDSLVRNTFMYVNADYGNIRGIEVKLDGRLGRIFQGTLMYTYQASLTTGSDPTDYFYRMAFVWSAVSGASLPPPQALMVSSENRYHTIAGNLSLQFPTGWQSGTTMGAILEDLGLTATFRVASGLPYTPLPNTGGGELGPGNGFGSVLYDGTASLNSATMPWIKNIDLRVTRGFRLGNRSLMVFADFRNLFNWTNLERIFAETNDVVNARVEEGWRSIHVSGLVSEAGALWSVRDVTKNGVTSAMYAMDLTDCSQYAPSRSYGLPNCLMLRRTEERFGDGDHVLDESELDAAMGAFYLANRGPWTMYGPGLNVRFGVELNF